MTSDGFMTRPSLVRTAAISYSLAMATTFIAVCMALLVLEIGAIMGAVIFLVLRVKNTTKAVEVLAYRIEDQVLSFRTGWIRSLQGVASLVTGFMSARKN
jgi:hypothetical protein